MPETKQCSCGAELMACPGKFQPAPNGGPNLWCNFCKKMADPHVHQGSTCNQQICSKSQRPVGACYLKKKTT